MSLHETITGPLERHLEPVSTSDMDSLRTQFVSNLNGSYPGDILLATLPGPLSVSLTSLLLPFLLPKRYIRLRFASRIWIHVLIELCTVSLPLLLSFTVLADSNAILVINLLIVIVSLLVFAHQRLTRSEEESSEDVCSTRLPERKPPFLTNYRAGMNLCTCLCILAVDFPIFPRRFAKTETYGYSLMDVGVGSFIIANGLNSRSINSFPKIMKKVGPIFLLGFLRLVSVKLSGYHEHVTEYGVHWNFFFTLALVKVMSAFITTNFRPAVLATTLWASQQLLLKLGLETWIMGNSPRENLISANREGLFSLIGYLALYYLAMELGDFIHKPKSNLKDWIHLSTVLTSLSLGGWMALPCVEAILGRPSRRLTNPSFCFWMLTYNITVLTVYSIIDLCLVWLEFRRSRRSDSGHAPDAPRLPIVREPYLMSCINENGLIFFLLANVITGMINFTFDTIHMGLMNSMIILVGYCGLLTIPVVVLYLWQIHS